MRPTINEGDELTVNTKTKIGAGDIIVFQLTRNTKLMCKRVHHVLETAGGKLYWVVSDNIGRDSKDFGYIPDYLVVGEVRKINGEKV